MPPKKYDAGTIYRLFLTNWQIYETHLSASERETIDSIWLQLSPDNGGKDVHVPKELLDKLLKNSPPSSSSGSSSTPTFKSGPFSSPLLLELIKMIKERRPSDSAQEWASKMENEHAIALIGDPCVDLSADEVKASNTYIDDMKNLYDVDLRKTFPKPERDPHLAAVTKLLSTMPIEQSQEPRVEDGTMHDIQLWEDFLKTPGGEVISFEEWSSIRAAYRRTGKRKQLTLPVAKSHRLMCALSTLPDEWFVNLNRIILKTDLSEVVAMYEGIEITREDIAKVLPTSAVSTTNRGWLNDKVIEIFLKIIGGCKKLGGTKTVVVNSYVVENLRTTAVTDSAKKAGIEATTIPDIDTILFPMHQGNHWLLVAAFPKTRVLILYDSLPSGQEDKKLSVVRDWLKKAIGEGKDADWELKVGDCPRQNDGSLCGVCMCINAMAVVFGKEPKALYTSEDGGTLRQYIATVICKGSFPFTQ